MNIFFHVYMFVTDMLDHIKKFMCMTVYFHVCMCTVCMCGAVEIEGVIEVGTSGGCESPWRCQETNPGPW